MVTATDTGLLGEAPLSGALPFGVTLSPLEPRYLQQATGAWRAHNVEADGRSLTDLTGNGRHLLPGGVAGATPTSNDPTRLVYDGTRYLWLDGASGNYASVPDEAALDIIGDIDIRCAASAEDWGAGAKLLGKRGGSRSYLLRIFGATGNLQLLWSTDGTSGTEVSQQSTAPPPVDDGDLLLVRVTLDVDNGAGGYDVTFYTKTSTPAAAAADLRDDTGWTQLGAVVTGGAPTSIFAGNADLRLGTGGFDTEHFVGRFYAAVIKDGIDGTTVLDVDFTRTDLFPDGSESTSGTAVTGQTVTLNGRATLVTSTRLYLDGVDDWLSVADDPAFDVGASDAFTAVLVMQSRSDMADGERLFGHRFGDGWLMLVAADGSDDVLRGFFQSSAGTEDNVGSITDLSDSAVRSLALVRTSSNQKSYVGSVLDIDSADSTTGTSLANTAEVTVGAANGGATSNANMQVFGAAIFVGRALTAAEIAQVGRELAYGETALAA